MSGDWVELLLTDSLDRPLGSAPYLLDRGAELEHGRLTPDGRVSFRWPSPSGPRPDRRVRLLVCHRTLVLAPGPTEGLAWDRNRLTNLGFDAGTPNAPPDPLRVAEALAAFVRSAELAVGGRRRARRERGDDRAPDPRALLDAWYTGDAGLAPVLRAARFRPASPPGLLRRWFARRRAAAAQAERSGSHLGGSLGGGGRRVAIAVAVGPVDSAASRNRIVVYDWFSGLGTPPRDGTGVETLIDGEEAWGSVADDLELAETEVCMSTWYADPDIELRRPMALALTNPEVRRRFRLSTLLDNVARRGGSTALLIWNWLGTPLVHPTLRRWALTSGEGVQVLQHDHPRILGSFHEKLIVVDRKVAYCGGFNLRQNDWDSQEHRVDDPRRNPHDLSGWDRRTSEPLYPPRHDIALRLEGPIVADIHDNFARHWNGTLRVDRRFLRRWLGKLVGHLVGIGQATPLAPMREPPVARGSMLAQFVRTDPRLRARQQAIVDVTLRAIHNARRFIYVENQFFRSPRIAAALVNTMRRRPRVEVIVVTNEIGPPFLWLNPFAYWTRRVLEQIRAERPSFELYSLIACGELDGAIAYRPVFIHSKVLVVDDEWATVGSANINDRSITSEYEANVAIENGDFASDLRRRLMAEHLGLDPADPRLVDPTEAARTWRLLADENAVARRARRLAPGRAHPFVQRGGVSWFRGRPEWF